MRKPLVLLEGLLLGAATPLLRDLGGWLSPLFLLALGFPFARPRSALWWAVGFAAAEAFPIGWAVGRYQEVVGLAVGGLIALAVLGFAYLPLRYLPQGVWPFAWVASEVLRLAFLGAGVGIVGYGLVDSPLGLLGRLGGVYLVSLVAVLLGRGLWRGSRLAWAAALLALPLPVTWGAGAPTDQALLVQGGLSPERKHLAAEVYPRLTSSARRANPGFEGIVVWPEAATPSPPLGERGWRWLGGVGTGDLNLAVLVEGSRVVAQRSKAFLVPMVEYAPGPLEGVRRRLLEAAVGGRVRLPENYGPRPGSLLPLGPYGALICYEGSLEGAAVGLRRKGARVLVTISNENTFDGTLYKLRRFREDRMRAVETGLWNLRVGETGFTGVIDPLGRVLKRAPEGTPAYLAASYSEVPQPSPYSWAREAFLAAYLLLPLAGLLLSRAKEVSSKAEAVKE